MPKTTDKIPDGIRPYAFHRLSNLRPSTGGQYIGDCPFCGGEDKLFINQETGQYRCVICPPEPGKEKHGGNVYTFMRAFWQACFELTSDDDSAAVAEERRVAVETVQRWGLVKSLTDGTWLVPQHSPKKEINNLYRWKYGMPSCCGISPGLFGLHLWDDAKPDVYLCEGWSSPMALEEALRSVTKNGPRLVGTSNPALSLLRTANVAGVPGCESFKDDWKPRFQGKRVFICFDSDYPKRLCKGCKKSYETVTNDKCPVCGETEGRDIPPAGYAGARMVANKLQGTAKSIHRLRWGLPEADVGYDPQYPSGYDIRDHLTAAAE